LGTSFPRPHSFDGVVVCPLKMDAEPNGVDVDSSQTAVPTQTEPTQTSQTTQPNTQPTQPTQSTVTAAPASNAIASSGAQQQQQQQQPTSPTAASSAPRPRDARMIELLLTSQGVTSYESRVPLMLMDFAYRHTSAILNDAVFLSADPYTSHASGPKASGQSGANAMLVANADASVSANAVRLAIASRQGFQFRAASAAQGGLSKEWLLEMARERNKVGLPKVSANEWAARLPSERFVLSGQSWGLDELYVAEGALEDEDEDVQMEDMLARAGPGGVADEAMEETGEEVEGGRMEDVFGGDVDEEME
jgi:transcription initiation factor TFIID subunit 9B